MKNDVLKIYPVRARGCGVRAAGCALAGFSPAMQAQERRLKAFMYERLYYHPDQKQTAERARDVIAALFVAYSEDAGALPESWRAGLPEREPERSRHIADFIAGMTDRFAIDQYARIHGRVPEGLRNV